MNKKLKYTGIGTITVLFIGFLYYFLFVNDLGTFNLSAWEQKYTEVTFDKEIWELNKEQRFTMSKDLIESKILIGKNLEEVTELLGEKYTKGADNKISYYLGFIPSPGNLDPDYIELTFKDGKVVKVRQYGT